MALFITAYICVKQRLTTIRLLFLSVFTTEMGLKDGFLKFACTYMQDDTYLNII